MKIVFDCRYVRTDHHDGISRFSARLISEFHPRAIAAGHHVTMLIHDEKQLEHLPELPWFKVCAPTSIKEPFVSRRINSLNPDVVFSPMQTIGARGKKFKLVLTIHDLIYYTHRTPPRQFNFLVRALWRMYHLSWWPQKHLLSRADAVVAVSKTTKRLIEDNKLTDKQIFVVHNAADGLTPGHSVASALERKKDLIYMGSFMPYKNVETLVRVANLLPSFTLHLLSKISKVDRDRLTKISEGNNVQFHNGVTDEMYADLLSQATALITASRDEGFGIPLVEAMSIGTPIVVSDIPIFHEIGQDAALYSPADTAEVFVSHILDLENPEYWSEHSQKSIRQAAQFSWSLSAQALLEALEKIEHLD